MPQDNVKTRWHSDAVFCHACKCNDAMKTLQSIKSNHNQSCSRRKTSIINQNKLLSIKLLRWHGERYILSRAAIHADKRAGRFLGKLEQGTKIMEKKDTIAATMKAFMASGPSVTDYPSYKSLNDHVGSLHGLPAGKVQALAGPKAWAWYADPTTKTWRKATPEEIAAKRENAAGKNHGVRAPKVMSPEDRAALDAQVTALETVANPALAPLLADLLARRNADDAARKGSLKDRLQAATDYLGAELAVKVLEWAVTKCEAGEILEAAENA